MPFPEDDVEKNSFFSWFERHPVASVVGLAVVATVLVWYFLF